VSTILRSRTSQAAAVLLIYAALTTIFATFRPELWLAGAAVAGLAFWRPRIVPLFERLIPYGLFLLAYDALRYGRDAFLTADRVAVCSMRSLEIQLLSFGGEQTPGEWLAQYRTPTLDLLFATPYFVFAYVVLGYALFLYAVDRERMSHFLWAFAIANLVAFVFWLFVPVAPPWYQHAHGCTANITAGGSPAGLTRVDAFLHIRYFSTLYGKSTYVFGAMPSMHCAYPMIGLLTAWKSISWRTRPFHLLYVTVMFVASVYLDHHYVLDGLVGFLVAALSVSVTGRLMKRHTSTEPISSTI
jgi:inositol phosphorylceramide synthase catalytic subunit